MPVSGAPTPTIPVVAVFPGTPGGVIWVVAGPFFHNPYAALTWQPPGSGKIHPGSVLGFHTSFPQDALIITGHMTPNHELKLDNEAQFHADIILKIAELQAVMGPDTPVIFVGFSEGGIELSATARHRANTVGGGKWPERQALVLVSTPYSSRYLRQPQAAMVESSLLFHPALGGSLSRRFGPKLAEDEIRMVGERWTGNPEDLDLLVELINRSAMDSPEMLQNAQLIAIQRSGFGDPMRTGNRVILLNLHNDQDTVVKVDENVRATMGSYPDAVNIPLALTAHGLLFADAAAYRNALALPAPHNSIRGYLAGEWRLAT